MGPQVGKSQCLTLGGQDRKEKAPSVILKGDGVEGRMCKEIRKKPSRFAGRGGMLTQLKPNAGSSREPAQSMSSCSIRLGPAQGSAGNTGLLLGGETDARWRQQARNTRKPVRQILSKESGRS